MDIRDKQTIMRNLKGELTKEEKSVLFDKLVHPEKELKCPRCKNALIWIEKGSSIKVKCATDQCIYMTCRGL